MRTRDATASGADGVGGAVHGGAAASGAPPYMPLQTRERRRLERERQ